MKSRAFTVVELLVAVTIAVVMAGLMLVITRESLMLWGRSQGDSSTSAQATLALDQLQRDLESAILRADGKTWLSIVVENDPTRLAERNWLTGSPTTIKPLEGSTNLLPAGSPDKISEARFGLGGVWLRLVTTNISSSGGRPVAVSYQINRRPVVGNVTVGNPADVRYLLLREELSPAATLTATDVLFADKSTPTALVKSTPNDTLAINVVDLGIWLYRRDSSNQLERIFPTAAGGPMEYSVPSDGIPSEADLMVRILTDQGAVTIAAMENGLIPIPDEFQGNSAQWWWSMVEANSDAYVRRVKILTALP